MRWLVYAAAGKKEFRAFVDDDAELAVTAAALREELGHADQVLLSYLDDDYSFCIPAEFWTQLANAVEGIGLSLYVKEGYWARTTPAPQTDVHVSWRAGSTTIVEGNDLDETVRRLTEYLQTIEPSARGLEIDLIRFARGGQFNLYLEHDVVQTLSKYRVTLHGG